MLYSIYTTIMKRRDLIRTLRDAASGAKLEFTSLRNTGGHEVFSLDGLRIPIPNHREIAEGTARSILRQAAAKLGEEWWT
jgi:predicted RNA binding protein YcfA (HicA-like mRNA interferase family)